MRALKFISCLFLFIIVPCGFCSTFEVNLLTEDVQHQIKEFKIWKEGCPVSLDRLRIVKFSYYDFSGAEKEDGEITVLDVVSNRVLNIFKELHRKKFPIAKAYPINIIKEMMMHL